MQASKAPGCQFPRKTWDLSNTGDLSGEACGGTKRKVSCTWQGEVGLDQVIRKAVSARQGTDLGTGGLRGSRQVDCSIIGLARYPHTSIKCFQQPCEGRLDPPIFQMRKRRLGAMQGTCRDPSVGTWQRTFSATPCPLLILFQAHSLCLEVLCSGAQLHLY